MEYSLTRRRLLASTIAAWPVVVALGPLTLSACSQDGNMPRAASKGFLDALADIVIPATETPGAKVVNVADFMARAFERGLFGADAATGGALEELLNKRLGRRFMSTTPADRVRVVRDLDTEIFGSATPAPVIKNGSAQTPDPAQLWRSAKSAIIVGYYMSETGAAQELRYEPVPGRYEPDVAFKPGDTYLSNNWNANIG